MSVSLRWRLSLAASALIVAVVAALLTASYFQIESTLVDAAEARALSSSEQLANLLEQSVATRERQVERVASDATLRRYLRFPTAPNEAATRTLLESLGDDENQRIDVWGDDGELRFSFSSGAGAVALPQPEPPVSPGTGPLRAEGDVLFSDVVAAVRSDERDESLLGYLVVRRGLASSGAGDVLGGLVGSGASVAIGGGDVWTDLSGRVAAPPVGGGSAESPERPAQIGALSGIGDAPWNVWVGFPRDVVAAPAVEFMTRMAAAAGLFLLASMALTAIFAGRITGPLLELTEAAERIAAGHDARVSEPTRADEVGRLASAFNLMADRVHGAQARLEARARELAESEERKTAILESAMDAVVTTDEAGTIVGFNQAAERMFGKSREHALGASLNDLLPAAPTARARLGLFRDLVSDHVARGRRVELSARRADGSVFPAEASVAPLPGSGRALFTGFIRDLSETRERDEALRRSEVRFQRIFGSGIVGIVVSDEAGTILEANDAFLEMTGRGRDELERGAVSWSALTPEPWAAADESAARLLASDGVAPPYEKECLRTDGSRVPVIVGSAVLEDGLRVSVVHDITQRKRFEAERARAVQLEAENRRIEEANRLKSEFLANMSHELRTPLNAIIGFTELLNDGAVTQEMPEYPEFTGDILTSARHLLQLINDVLDLSKVEAGRLEFRPETVVPERLVGEVVSVLRTVAAGSRVRVETEISAELGEVTIDAARLKQVLYNYLSNALKFTPEEGRVTIRVLTEPGDAFRLEVEDTGIGIASADLDRLFVEFEQLDAGAAKAHGGTGLGLALTRRLVEAQGGRVGVESEEGRGSVFWAILPRHARGGSPLPSPRSYTATNGSAPMVLVVEDDPGDQEQIVRILQDRGYAVETAATAAQAVARARERTFDAVTLDLLLPDGSGLDVLRAMRDGDRNRDVPVVVVTVVAESGAVAGFRVHDILSKPLDETTLLESLARAGVHPDRAREILVVEDDPGSLRLMVQTLTRSGYQARGCERADEALRVASEAPPTAVVLDLVMPEMDGFAFLAGFRELPGCRTVPVIVWTMKDLNAEEHARLSASAHAVVGKGPGPSGVIDELARSLAPSSHQVGREVGA